MSFRTKLLPALDRVDQILGPNILDLIPTQVVLNIATWSGGRRGVGIATIQSTPLPSWTRVRHVTTREIAGSGGRYESGDIVIGPIRPTFTRPDGTTGGFSEQALDPQGIQQGTDVYFSVSQTDPTGTGIFGDYILIEFRRDRPMRFMLVCKRKRTTPTDVWLPSTPSGLQLWWQDDSITFNGTSVTGWTDKSTNGRNGTASGSLTYNAADANYAGLPSVLGATGSLSSPAFNLPCPYEAVVVAAGLSGAGHQFWARGATDYLADNASFTYFCNRGANTTGALLTLGWGEFGASPRTLDVSTDGTFTGTNLYINGLVQTLSNQGGNAGTAASTSVFTVFPTGSASTIAFIAIYNRVLSKSERTQMNTYLRNRYSHY